MQLYFKASTRHHALTTLVVLLLALCGGCQTMYYDAMEELGFAKREILVDRVAEASDSQDAAQEAYIDALTRFRAVVDFDGGDLEQMYNHLHAELEEAKAGAAELGDRIDAVESVAQALFEEWDTELAQYQSASLRAKSKARLEQTRARYQNVRDAMRRAQASFQPALAALNDQTLFLKHNLNAAAIGAIKAQLPRVEEDAERLRRDLELATEEANRFLREFESKDS